MNVLHIVAWDNLGGVCRVVNRVGKHLQSRGHGVHLLLAGEGNWPEPIVSREGFPAYRLLLRSPVRHEAPVLSRVAFWLTLPRTLLAIRAIIRRHDIHVVNVHFPAGNTLGIALMRRAWKIRIVTSVHGSDLLPDGVRRHPAPAGLIALLRASDAIVVPSDAFGIALHAAWPEIDTARLRTVPNGVDPHELGYAADADDTTIAPPYVLSIAHLATYKGVDVLIRAFAAVAGAWPELRLKLVSDGPARADLEALATSLGVRSRVDFLGTCERPQVAELLRGCTLFVLPSRSNSESFGIAAAEAMALDRAVIASRVGGLPGLIEDGVSGLLVPPGDDAALATAMQHLLTDPALRRALGTEAGVRVRRDYPWHTTGSRYEEVFLRVTGLREST